MNAQIWPIPGGIHPPENKQQSTQVPIGEIALPKELVLPIGNNELSVSVGDKVLAGQKIGEPSSIMGVAIHAPSSGTITAIENRPQAHASGLDAPSVMITLDGEHNSIEYQETPDFTKVEPAELIDRIRQAGIAGLGGAGFPTAIKLQPKHKIDTLILNGTECEPYITADDMLMRERAHDVVAGSQLLAHILGNPRIVIGIEDNKPEAIAAVTTACKGTPVEVISFPTKYPSGGEKQLIQILTGNEIPSGAIPAHLGIVVQNVGTAASAYQAIRYGKPLTSRITTVVGECVGLQRNVEVLIGTPIKHVLEAHQYKPEPKGRVIMGGPMMGFTLQSLEAPVLKTTNCLLAPSNTELPLPPPAQACIRCGLCAEACPVSLLPQQLFWYSKSEDYEKAERYNLFDCIECGACSYVCPSSIPLVQYYRAAKGNIRQERAEKRKADHARERFEFRKQRLEQEEAEKEAKRAARKAAAEKAKQQAAKASANDAPAPAKDDPVAAAMARVAAQANDPAAQKAKLERSVQSAKDRLDKAQNRLLDADSGNQDMLKARIKEAEKRLADAEHSLKGFLADHPEQAPAEQATPASEKADAPKDAATAAIEKAKAQAEKQQNLSEEEKAQAKKDALIKRLDKARARLAKAQEEQDENVEAFAAGVSKLEEKLAALEAEHGTD